MEKSLLPIMLGSRLAGATQMPSARRIFGGGAKFDFGLAKMNQNRL
ncbi:hypothetical protein DSM14862_03524 (plasmid) [Sulfitobacter indolifex]|nr:hypothetical protein DSM14862_03524 [Sulfitobacter indolifex]